LALSIQLFCARYFRAVSRYGSRIEFIPLYGMMRR